MQVFHRDGEGEFWVSVQERPEGELAFDARQWGAETVMDAVPEGEVTGLTPVEVEPLGAGVSVRVSVRRRKANDDLSAGGDCDATEIQRPSRVSKRRVRDGCVEAEELLHGLWDLGGIGAELSQRDGVGKRGDDVVAEGVGGCAVTGDNQLKNC